MFNIAEAIAIFLLGISFGMCTVAIIFSREYLKMNREWADYWKHIVRRAYEEGLDREGEST